MIPIPENVLSRMKTINDAGYECYIVGSASLYHYAAELGITLDPPKDVDLFTNAFPNITRLFPDAKPMGNHARF